MSAGFSTSLRRDPRDLRGLLERIEAQLRERLEEAVDFFCLDLMVQLRRHHGRPLPTEESRRDREEFKHLVREFLEFLKSGFLARLAEADAEKLRQLEIAAKDEGWNRLIVIQTHLARSLPDYWQRFDEIKTEFARARLATAPPEPAERGRGDELT